ncbi:MAG: alpha/beta hydrolase [Alphaproteobacteria bacterium]|nr:alpha/beta hydrolase [Alphaproteobacteria bacterium]
MIKKWPLLIVVIVALGVGSCAKLTLAWADLKPDGPAARPEALGAFGSQAPVASLEDWTVLRRPALKEALQANIYGYFPDSYKLTVLDRKLLDENAFGGGRLEEYKLRAQLQFGETSSETETFYMDVVTPAGSPNAPVILIQTFCPRWDTLPHPAVYRPEGAGGCGGGPATGVMTYVFGRYIATPPTQMILARGYAVATIYPSEFAPDDKDEGLAALKQMSAGLAPDKQRWGAIAAWAWGYSLMIDALEQDAEGPRDYISWGHSRYGKSALLAAAFDDRISAVISHQSGTGGASLNRQKKGESVKAIIDAFPHWFAKAYEKYAGEEETMPIDQHQLLALIAPRPVLLGNARRDVWSDPNGAFRAAVGADPVYKLYGAQGLDQNRLDIWEPAADLAYWIRPGTHGVVKEDWPAFLEFLDAHFLKK